MEVYNENLSLTMNGILDLKVQKRNSFNLFDSTCGSVIKDRGSMYIGND